MKTPAVPRAPSTAGGVHGRPRARDLTAPYFVFVLLLSMIVVQVPSAPCVSILKL
jgi:hypothetical protein